MQPLQSNRSSQKNVCLCWFGVPLWTRHDLKSWLSLFCMCVKRGDDEKLKHTADWIVAVENDSTFDITHNRSGLIAAKDCICFKSSYLIISIILVCFITSLKLLIVQACCVSDCRMRTGGHCEELYFPTMVQLLSEAFLHGAFLGDFLLCLAIKSVWKISSSLLQKQRQLMKQHQDSLSAALHHTSISPSGQ